MSASEWDLPKPWWIASRFQQHGFPPMRDSFVEAISISHSLQQFVSAYFCDEVAENGLITCFLMQSIPERRLSRLTSGGWNFRDVAHRTYTV